MDGLGEWPLSEVVPLVTAARRAGQRVTFVGTGTERLHRPGSRRLIEVELAPRVERWTVRTERDRDRLLGCGVPADRVIVAADLAWLLEPAGPEFGKRVIADLGVSSDESVIGINVNNEAAMLQEQPQLFTVLASFADELARSTGVRVMFFCSEVREGQMFDKEAARQVLKTMRTNNAVLLPNRYWTPQQLASILSRCDLVVSTRLHVCLLSALQAVPFIALQRSDKVRDLCVAISWPFGTDLPQLQTKALLEHAETIRTDRPTLQAHLREASAAQAARSQVSQVVL